MARTLLIAAAAFALAACGEAPPVGSQGEALGKDYTLVVRADEEAHYYLVAHEDGRLAAARAVPGGDAELLSERAARALLSQPRAFAAVDPGEADVAIRMPGFSLAVKEGGPDNSEQARVSINIAGHGVEIDAVDGEGGEAERAHVRITGADEEAARDFIAEAESLTPDVRAEMLTALGL